MVRTLYKKDRDKFIKDFNKILDCYDEGFILVLTEDDSFNDGRTGEELEREMAERLSERLEECPDAVLATPKRLFQFPNRLAGVMIRLDVAHKLPYRLNPALKYNYEADYLLKLIEGKNFLVQQDEICGLDYIQGDPGDGNYREFHGSYYRDWYIDNMRDYLIPMLKDNHSFIAQYYALYSITCRLEANQNNLNRHVLSEKDIDLFMELISEALQYVDDELIMNANRYPVYKRDYQFCRMLLRIKYNPHPGMVDDAEFLELCEASTPDQLHPAKDNGEAQDNGEAHNTEYEIAAYHHTQGIGRPELYIITKKEGVPVYSTYSLKCNIQLMDIRGNRLELDGSVPDIYDKNEVDYYFVYDGKRYMPEFCERYSLTKYFGKTAYKRFPFHVSIPLSDEDLRDFTLNNKSPRDISSNDKRSASSNAASPEAGNLLSFRVCYKGVDYPVAFDFKSHTSRLAAYPRNSYWHSGNYILTAVHSEVENNNTNTASDVVTAISIRPYNWFYMASREFKVGWELLTSFRMHRFRFLLLRMAWIMTRPYFKNKEIWLFFDKIYKAGDSAEYLYKFSDNKRLNFSKKRATITNSGKKYPDKLYYLVDENVPDYARLKREGYKPLKRGSFLHRLVFLNANMLIVSNSTVFAFNDYYLENSRYIRGIPDFSVVCVQHGLSVQKIALAQQRLRDNTRLYFCASRYEIENLSHPVYDYVGYDALKLTGVPRYDGLVDKTQKQILISPTWRMQSAVPVSKNEGVERDYNPDFKQTQYFKTYNSLINDRRLIEAAEKYGYRIKYILHPIVSPQADDFDRNDYVDIVPATGDMSYEELFCTSSLMVTDYSGIQFDFAYMRKPLVYFHPEELEAHYEEGTFHYDTMAFGEIVRKKDELVTLLTQYMAEGCHMKEYYRMRADDFFEFSDRNNCARIYDELINYINKKG